MNFDYDRDLIKEARETGPLIKRYFAKSRNLKSKW